MKKNVIEIEDVKTLVPQLQNEKVIKALLDMLHVTDANVLHARHCDKRGADFTDAILHDLGVTLQIENEERQKDFYSRPGCGMCSVICVMRAV